MAFGAITEYAQFSRRLIEPLLARARSVGGLIATVMATGIGLNIFAGDQYVAIILPARIFLSPSSAAGSYIPKTWRPPSRIPPRSPPRWFPGTRAEPI